MANRTLNEQIKTLKIDRADYTAILCCDVCMCNQSITQERCNMQYQCQLLVIWKACRRMPKVDQLRVKRIAVDVDLQSVLVCFDWASRLLRHEWGYTCRRQPAGATSRIICLRLEAWRRDVWLSDGHCAVSVERHWESSESSCPLDFTVYSLLPAKGWAGPRGTAIPGQPVEKSEQAPASSPSSKNQFNIDVPRWRTYQILSW